MSEHAGPEAIVLLAHGSPDPDWMLPVHEVAARMRAATPCPVYTATLEHGTSLADVVAALAADRARYVVVVPLFLSPGGRHIKRDVPALVAAVQTAHPDVALRLSPGAIGMDEPVLAALASAALLRAGLEDMP
jgi:sirohydrochlorin cobaltochelatase